MIIVGFNGMKRNKRMEDLSSFPPNQILHEDILIWSEKYAQIKTHV